MPIYINAGPSTSENRLSLTLAGPGEFLPRIAEEKDSPTGGQEPKDKSQEENSVSIVAKNSDITDQNKQFQLTEKDVSEKNVSHLIQVHKEKINLEQQNSEITDSNLGKCEASAVAAGGSQKAESSKSTDSLAQNKKDVLKTPIKADQDFDKKDKATISKRDQDSLTRNQLKEKAEKSQNEFQLQKHTKSEVKLKEKPPKSDERDSKNSKTSKK